MKIKKMLSVILCLTSVFALTACRDEGENATVRESETVIETVTAEDEFTTENVSIADGEKTSESTGGEADADPSDLTAEQVVEMYREAALLSDSFITSDQKILLKSISVNNGEHEKVMGFITSIMSKLLSKNSKEQQGITGGYKALSADDTVSAKAYKSGDGTVIELVMREQTSGPVDDANSGTVGHAITAVGDIGYVIDQMKDLGLPLEISEKETKIYYTEPTVRVYLDSDGRIVSGTWRYSVEIRMNNYKAFGKTVETTSVIMENIITVKE